MIWNITRDEALELVKDRPGDTRRRLMAEFYEALAVAAKTADTTRGRQGRITIVVKKD